MMIAGIGKRCAGRAPGRRRPRGAGRAVDPRREADADRALQRGRARAGGRGRDRADRGDHHRHRRVQVARLAHEQPLHRHQLRQHPALGLLAGVPGGHAAEARLDRHRPVAEAGKRKLPPMSLPCASAPIPAITAAPAPPEEPPGETCRPQGLCVRPWSGLSVSARKGEFRRVRPPDHHRAGVEQVLDQRRVVRRDHVLERRRPRSKWRAPSGRR
jgi:hypothetical protein